MLSCLIVACSIRLQSSWRERARIRRIGHYTNYGEEGAYVVVLHLGVSRAQREQLDPIVVQIQGAGKRGAGNWERCEAGNGLGFDPGRGGSEGRRRVVKATITPPVDAVGTLWNTMGPLVAITVVCGGRGWVCGSGKMDARGVPVPAPHAVCEGGDP